MLPLPREAPVGRHSVKCTAAVAGATALGAVVGDRSPRRKSLRTQPFSRDTAGDERITHGGGAGLAQAAIESRPPDGIGMAFDAQRARTAPGFFRESIEKRTAAGVDRGTAAGKLDLLAGQHAGEGALTGLRRRLCRGGCGG